jgi:hypothetical protein
VILGGFIFLRFITPAITTLEALRIDGRSPGGDRVQRNLTLVRS